MSRMHTKRSRDVPDEEVSPYSKLALRKAIYTARRNSQPCLQDTVVPLNFLVQNGLLPKYRELFPDEQLDYDGKQLLLRIPGAAALDVYHAFSEIDNPHRSKRAAVQADAALEETLARKSMAYMLLQSAASLQFSRGFLSQLKAGLLQAIQHPEDEVFAGVVPANKRNNAELLCDVIEETVSQVAFGRKLRFWWDSDTGELFVRVPSSMLEQATAVFYTQISPQLPGITSIRASSIDNYGEPDDAFVPDPYFTGYCAPMVIVETQRKKSVATVCRKIFLWFQNNPHSNLAILIAAGYKKGGQHNYVRPRELSVTAYTRAAYNAVVAAPAPASGGRRMTYPMPGFVPLAAPAAAPAAFTTDMTIQFGRRNWGQVKLYAPGVAAAQGVKGTPHPNACVQAGTHWLVLPASSFYTGSGAPIPNWPAGDPIPVMPAGVGNIQVDMFAVKRKLYGMAFRDLPSGRRSCLDDRTLKQQY